MIRKVLLYAFIIALEIAVVIIAAQNPITHFLQGL